MPLDHTKATATVSVTGLSVGCFNPETRKWEVALIRHPRHILTINVTRRAEGNKSSQVTFELDQAHSIFIDANEPVITKGKQVFTRDPFDRKKPEISDPEDFRWIVDLEREFNDGAPIKILKPQMPVTELFVSHPVLYADRNDKLDDMNVLKFNGNGAAAEATELFGSLSESAKADITCKPNGSVVLRIEGPLGFKLPLPYVEGATHEIRIQNVCPDPKVEIVEGQPVVVGEPAPSDFKIYFDLFKPNSGAKFDLKKVNPEEEGSDAVCNNTFLGSSKSLLPL